MSKRRLNVPAILMVGFCLLFQMSGVFQAVTTIIDPDSGELLTVDVITDPIDPVVQGVRLRTQPPGGTTTSETIPSTYDPYLDNDPVIGKGPDSDIVVVWSRHDGSDFELALARRLPTYGWEHLSLLTQNALADTQPRVIVDGTDTAHVMWWGNDLGGPVYLQAFDPVSGEPIGPRHRPLDPPGGRLTPTYDPYAGGLDDPGIPTKGGYKATANPCLANPAAAPDHGVLMSCGRPVAWQVTGCQLTVGTYSTSTSQWGQTVVDLSNVGTTSAQSIAQSIGDYKCH
jgi:hypothetical protein